MKRNVIKISTIIPLLLISSIYGQDAPLRLNLEKAITLALENNETVLISKNDVKTAGAQIREAWAEALPEIIFTGAYTRNIKRPVIFLPAIFFFPDRGLDEQIPITIGSKNAYSFFFTIEQPIYQAGKVSAGIKAARLYKKFSNEGVRAVEDNIIFAVKKSFYTVLLNQQLLDINQQSLDQSLAHLINTRKLFMQGQVTELDTLRAWVDYTNLQPLVIWAENNLRMAENQLKELIGLKLEDKIDLDGALEFAPGNGISTAEVFEEALQKRPELKQLEYQTGLYRQNMIITRADLLPNLSFRGLFQYDAQSEKFDFGPGLQNSISAAIRLEVPIFNGFRTPAKMQQARLDYENSQLQLQMFKDQLKTQIEGILLNLKEAAKRVQVQQHAIDQAERALWLAERQYNEGVGTRIEIGDARLALNLTKTNYVQAVYDYQVAQAELNQAIGRE